MNEKSSIYWKQHIEVLLTGELEQSVTVLQWLPVGGGCINDCYKLMTSSGIFFMKRNDAKKFPSMFESEALGLNLLNTTVEGIAPKVIAKDSDDHEQSLILEWIEAGASKQAFWNEFARKLSLLHRQTQDTFGWEHSNFMGALPQDNSPLDDWISFFILRRIEPQLRMAIDDGQLPAEIHRSFDKLFGKLPAIFPEEKPSLVHGDLWAGNFMVTADEGVRLIDPAVYYGHREMDLSMTKLFGGFDRSFYQHYQEYFPLESNLESRSDIYNLYPLLIHVNLFGGHYSQQVISIVKRFT